MNVDHDALIAVYEKQIVLLERIARDTKVNRDLLTQFVNSMIAAESEIPESLRRFMNYFHDLHDIKYMYEELGQSPPKYIPDELERCDDRYRHILDDLKEHLDRIRRDMAGREGNRWDHTRLLPKGNGI